MDFWENLQDAYSNVGKMFEESGKAFANGNIVGGIEQGLVGVFSGIGNTITLGGANAIGNAAYNDLQEKECVTQTIDENGVVKTEVNGGGLAGIVGTVAADRANNYVRQDYYEGKGEIGLANGEAAIALGEDAALAVSVGLGVHGVAAAGSAAAGATSTVGAGANGAIVATNTAKGATAVAMTKAIVPAVGKSVVNGAIINAGAQVVGTASDNIMYDRNDGNSENDKSAAEHFEEIVVRDAKQAVGAAGNVVEKGLAAVFPGLARFINTAKAGTYATGVIASTTSVGSYATAVCAKASEAVKGWCYGRKSSLKNKTIEEIAAEKREDASARAVDGWAGVYTKRVKVLDRELGIDSSTRGVVQRFDTSADDNPEPENNVETGDLTPALS